MSVMSFLNDFLLTTTAKTRLPRLEAPRGSHLQSSMLFQQVLGDIAEKQYDVHPDNYIIGELWLENDGEDDIQGLSGYAIVVNPNIPLPLQITESAKIHEMLRDLQVEDHDNLLYFDIRNAAVTYDRKMDLFDVLKSYIANPENKLRSADQIGQSFRYHRGVPKHVQGAEFISENVRAIRKTISGNQDLAKDLFYAVACKPYISKQHYLFASGVAGLAGIMVSMQHLQKTICLEDGLPIPQAVQKTDIPGEYKTEPLPGGYN